MSEVSGAAKRAAKDGVAAKGKASGLSASDVLLVVGVLALLGGIAAFDWRVSMIAGGLMSLGAMWMMERAAARAAQPKGKGN